MYTDRFLGYSKRILSGRVATTIFRVVKETEGPRSDNLDNRREVGGSTKVEEDFSSEQGLSSVTLPWTNVGILRVRGSTVRQADRTSGVSNRPPFLQCFGLSLFL